MFPTNESVADVRRSKQWVDLKKNGQDIYVCKKFYQTERDAKNEIPLIRLTEMYFIVMEATTSATEANQLYGEYASTRGVSSNVDLTSNRENVLKKEFNKEFYAEGQMFFFYKRTGATSALDYSQLKPESYVVPLPEREIIYNNK